MATCRTLKSAWTARHSRLVSEAIASDVSSRSLLPRAQMSMFAPDPANLFAMLFPMPLLPPVTSATLPDRSSSMSEYPVGAVLLGAESLGKGREARDCALVHPRKI